MKIVGEVVHRGCHNTTEEEHNQIARQDVEWFVHLSFKKIDEKEESKPAKGIDNVNGQVQTECGLRRVEEEEAKEGYP